MSHFGKENDRKTNDDVIDASSFISFTMGDPRRPSFIVGAAERASQSYGIKSKSIFEGEWALKKFSDELFFKKRYVWIDLTDNTVHWCKVPDRSSPHKRIKLSELSSVVIGPPARSSFLDGRHPSELCFTMDFKNGRSIDFKMLHPSKVEDWVKVVSAIGLPDRGGDHVRHVLSVDMR
mmetsp:Transcript_4995/g.7632  ORF Transcript_4995/g.7632 Transcript_4995/m.7632 type:complete len:178 (+) Transcript_4995:34-567(+)